MKLIGMLDSPFVRRVAISMRLLGLPFEHAAISVFRGFDAFQQINPVVKAPTLICRDEDGGSVLMDSTLMLIYAEALAGSSSQLHAWPVWSHSAGTPEAACWRLVECGALPTEAEEPGVRDWGRCVDDLERMLEDRATVVIACVATSTCDELRGLGAPHPYEDPFCWQYGNN